MFKTHYYILLIFYNINYIFKIKFEITIFTIFSILTIKFFKYNFNRENRESLFFKYRSFQYERSHFYSQIFSKNCFDYKISKVFLL